MHSIDKHLANTRDIVLKLVELFNLQKGNDSNSYSMKHMQRFKYCPNFPKFLQLMQYEVASCYFTNNSWYVSLSVPEGHSLV